MQISDTKNMQRIMKNKFYKLKNVELKGSSHCAFLVSLVVGEIVDITT